MNLSCQRLLHELIQHGLQIAGGMGFQLRAEGFGGRPEAAQNHLGNGERTLCVQSLKRQIGGDGIVSQRIDIGGAVVQHVVALDLGFLAGQILRQLHGVHGIGGLGVDAVDLAAKERAHLNLLAVTGEGWQLAAAVVVAQLFLNRGGDPCAGHAAGDGVADAARQNGVITGHECGVIAERPDRFRGGKAVGVVEVDDLLAVLDGQRAAVAKEEGSQIPAVGDVHMYLLAGSVGSCQNAVQRLQVVLGEHGLVVVQEVAVIGGGNVSMDAVRTAKRLGAKKVSIVYRRRVADMTALPAEIEGAVAEGIEVQTLMAPSRIETDENGHVKGIYVTPQMISKIKDGRASVRPTGAPDVFIPCQTLIVAIGQDIEYQHFEEAGVPVQRGKILTEKYGGFDNIPGVFAGGDCASGPASVIKAIAAAKVVAANIDEYLGYHHIISCDVEIPEARLDDRPPCGRVNMTEREACERVCDFNGVENCMSEAEAKQEASRCLRCDHFGYGIFKGGRETLW